MKILDCRAKEVLLKRPYNKHWKAIEKLVKEIKTHLIERWDKSEIL